VLHEIEISEIQHNYFIY